MFYVKEKYSRGVTLKYLTLTLTLFLITANKYAEILKNPF